MARKQPISPNQTVLWAYEALAPEWGSPALQAQARDGQLHDAASVSNCTTGDKAGTEIHEGQLAAERSVSALVCAYSRSDLGRPLRGHADRRRAARQRVRRTARLDHLV